MDLQGAPHNDHNERNPCNSTMHTILIYIYIHIDDDDDDGDFILVIIIFVIWMDGCVSGRMDGPSLIFVVTPMICTEAKQGNAEVVSSLLRAGADKDQLTSKGRSALQLARSADVYGSHLQAVGLCGSGVHMIQTYKPTDRRTGIQAYRHTDV